MKFGMRTPSLKRRISARTSPKRFLAHNVGVKMPKGYGWVRSPKKFAYNKVYNKTTFSIDSLFATKNGRISKFAPQNSVSTSKSKENKTKKKIRVKNPKTVLVLSVILGLLGGHRLYLGKPFSATIMTFLSLSGTGLVITIPWILFDIINIINGATMAKYDHKRLVNEYNNILEEGFLRDFSEFNDKYPKQAKKYEESIILPLIHINVDGTMKEKIQSVKQSLKSSKESINSILDKTIKYDEMISAPLIEQICPFDIQKSEQCYFSGNSAWNEIRKDRTYGEYWKKIYSGTVVLTNKRIIFQTAEFKKKSIQFKDKPKIIIIDDGVFIKKAKGKSPIFSGLDNKAFFIQYSKLIKAFFAE